MAYRSPVPPRILPFLSRLSLRCFFLLPALLLLSCYTRSPYVSQHPPRLQSQLSTPSDWQSLASRLFGRLRLPAQSATHGFHIALSSESPSPFDEAIHGFLTEAVYRSGYSIALPGNPSVELRLSHQLVDHEDPHLGAPLAPAWPPDALTAPTIGISSRSHHQLELIVTLEASHADRLHDRVSAIHYVHRNHLALYQSAPNPNQRITLHGADP